jgi:hypothetical protein
MNIIDVNKFIKRFVNKSKTAWKYFLENYNEGKPTIDEFIGHFKPK